jgi:hypothetical protein
MSLNLKKVVETNKKGIYLAYEQEEQRIQQNEKKISQSLKIIYGKLYD